MVAASINSIPPLDGTIGAVPSERGRTLRSSSTTSQLRKAIDVIDLTWLALPIGLGLTLLTLLDVFMTVLHVQAESPISNKFNLWFWHSLLWVGQALPKGARDELLAWGAPLMIAATFACWALFYIVGFALLYLPAIHDPAAFSVDAPHSAVDDALYFSAATFFTLGYGEIVPVHPLARLLSAFEAASGLVTISLSVTYLLSVYPLITRKVALAASLNQETDGRSDGVAVAERYVASGQADALGQRLHVLNDELLYLGHAHAFYPILFYVRPRQVHESFVRILALIQGLVATLRYGLDPSAHPEAVTDPRLLIFEEGFLYTLHVLSTSVHLDPRGNPKEDAARARDEFRALLDELAGCGVTPVSPEDRAAAEAHARFRATTDRYIRAYATNLGYPTEAVWRAYSRQDRGSALLDDRDVKP